MRQAIVVTYSANHYRYRASCAAGYVYFHSNDANNSVQNECAAATKLARKFGWKGVYFGGRLKNGAAVFVTPDTDSRLEVIS